MAYKRKYRKGERVSSVDDLLRQEFVYCYDQILNKGWFGSWQLRFAKTLFADHPTEKGGVEE